MNKLIEALKFRFLHILNKDEQRAQADVFFDAGETELARLDDLRRHDTDDDGHLGEWLDHDIQELENRLAWLRDFRGRLD